jgi:uncharacterized phiE125 gp8 family phage protein
VYSVSVKLDTGNEPVSEDQIKNYIKYDESEADEITLINSLVKSARELIEKYLNVSLKSKTYQLSFDYLSIDDYTIRIPYGPLVSITSLTFYDLDATTTALVEATDYYLRGNQFKEIYLPAPDYEGYYVLEYIAGYGGTNVEAIPAVLMNAICKQVMIWYERGIGEPLDKEVIGMISPYSKQYFI